MSSDQHRLEKTRLVIATHNGGKFDEFCDLLRPFGIDCVSATELGLPAPSEEGNSFEENAYTKSFAAARATEMPSLADDSGLAVEALGGAPGIHTALWAVNDQGNRDFAQGMERVEEALAKAGATQPGDRRARFIAVLCLAWPDGHAEFFRGEVRGHLVWPPRGTHGFGFDPVFQPDGHKRTFGEMEPDEKQGQTDTAAGQAGLSHRARAFARFAEARLERG